MKTKVPGPARVVLCVTKGVVFMRRLHRVLVLIAFCCPLWFFPAGGPPAAFGAVSDQEVQSTKSSIITGLKEKVKKLDYISRNYDSSVGSLHRAMDSLVTILDGKKYSYSNSVLGGTAHYPKTGGDTIYVSDQFFDRSRFGTVIAPGMSQEKKAEMDINFLNSQGSVLLHEAVHADQNLQFKAIQSIAGVTPLPGMKDKAEGEAYMIQYLMLKAMGGDGSLTEVSNSLMGIKSNYSSFYDFNKLEDIFRFHKRMGVDGALRLLDGGIDKAYDRLKKYEAALPAGRQTKLRISFKLVDDQGRPASGYIVKVKAFGSDPEIHYLFCDLKGNAKSDYMSWTDLAKTFMARSTYTGFLEHGDGRKVFLFKFTGEDLFKPGNFVKDSDGHYTINLGSATITGKKAGEKGAENGEKDGEKKQQQANMRLNVVGPGGKPVPAGSISIGTTSLRPIADEAEKIIQRPLGYAGKLATMISALISGEAGGMSQSVTRSVVSDGGDVTVDLSPMPDLPVYSDGWYQGMKDEEKISKFSAIVQKSEELFRKAMDSHGVVSQGGGPGWSLDEYRNRLLGVGDPNIYQFFSGKGYKEDPLKVMWKGMLQRQQDEAYTKAMGLVDFANRKLKEKELLEEEFYRDNFSTELIRLVIHPDEMAGGRYSFSFGAGQSPEEMERAIEETRNRYDSAIRRTDEFVKMMGDFFNDASIWKSYYQYNDLYRFVTADRSLPGMYDFFKRLLDTYRYEYASHHLLPLINSKDIVIGAMEESKSMTLSMRTAEETAAARPQEETNPQDQVGVLVNGRGIISDVPPVVIEGRTMVPLRSIAQELKCDVQWRDGDSTMIVTSGGKPPVEVPPGGGSLRVVVDGREVTGDVPPILMQGRILVPVRVVAETLGARVDWDSLNRLVLIQTALEKKPADAQPAVVHKPPVDHKPPVVQTVITDQKPPVKPPVEEILIPDHEPPVIPPVEEIPIPDHKPPVDYRPPVEENPVFNHKPPVDPPSESKPPAPQPVEYTAPGLQWDEWTVRSAGNGLPIEKDLRKKEDSPWEFSGDTISYSGTGTQLYHNDYVITRQEFDLSDILVTFEAAGAFRSDYGYTGPVIAFTKTDSIYQTVQAAGTIGAGGSYCWEPGKKDSGLLTYDYKSFRYYTEKFIDYGDNNFRSYTMRIKDGKLTLTLPEGRTYTVDVPETAQGLKMPLAISLRQYDRGKVYSLTIRNLKIVERPL